MDALESFTATIVRNLAKNGFPSRKVALPLERLYESADQKGLSFNRVLERLAAEGITHEKTPERVVFCTPELDARVATPTRAESGDAGSGAPSPNAAFPDLGPLAEGLGGLAGMPGLAGLNVGALAGMSQQELMAAASQAAQQLDPEQLAAVQNMVGSMGPEQIAALMAYAKKLGLG